MKDGYMVTLSVKMRVRGVGSRREAGVPQNVWKRQSATLILSPTPQMPNASASSMKNQSSEKTGNDK
jgi:hypothetical protein